MGIENALKSYLIQLQFSPRISLSLLVELVLLARTFALSVFLKLLSCIFAGILDSEEETQALPFSRDVIAIYSTTVPRVTRLALPETELALRNSTWCTNCKHIFFIFKLLQVKKGTHHIKSKVNLYFVFVFWHCMK